jgi:hypothetical protein
MKRIEDALRLMLNQVRWREVCNWTAYEFLFATDQCPEPARPGLYVLKQVFVNGLEVVYIEGVPDSVES